MKQENRSVPLSNGTTLELPLGLTYDIGQIALCKECCGVVQENEPLIRRSTYRSRIFEQEFAARSGTCLRCTQVLFTKIVARWYEKAESAVKNFNDLDQSAVKDEVTEMTLDVFEKSIESMEILIERIAAAIGDASNHQVEYAHDPTIRIDLPSADGTEQAPEQD